MPVLVIKDDVVELLQLMLWNNFSNSSFQCFDKKLTDISDTCFNLLESDYNVHVLENTGGSLCDHYPPKIFLCDAGQNNVQPIELSQLISQSKYARSRTRFVVPAFSFCSKASNAETTKRMNLCFQLFDTSETTGIALQNLCRSSTLSGPLEIYGRQVANVAGFTFDGMPLQNVPPPEVLKSEVDDGRSGINRFRDDDRALLRRLKVTYICDLMLEYRKIKYWVPVTSSEKVDQQGRYDDFVVLPLPFPGSEFFRVWKDSGYQMSGLMFDWNEPSIEVKLNPNLIPATLLSSQIDWKSYKSWDLCELTVNYLKLFLGILFEGAGGVLIHCISGWDRTPLFVSLLRCLLWADGLMHPSLNPIEMLYFTLAYDWFLFGHKLKTRMELGEEILRYGFEFMGQVAIRPDLSLRKAYDMSISSSQICTDPRSDNGFVDLRKFDELQSVRVDRLTSLSQLFLDLCQKGLSSPPILVPQVGSQLEPEIQDSLNLIHSSPVLNMESKVEPTISSSNDGSDRKSQNSVVSQISNALTTTMSAVASGLTKPLLRTKQHNLSTNQHVPDS